MLTESSCTLYIHNGIGFDRYYVSECHWQEDRAANVLKSGLQTADSVIVYIPDTVRIIAPDKSVFSSVKLYPNERISANNAAKDMLVKGKCEFIFDNTSAQSVSESMKMFRNKYPDFVTVSSIDRKLYGSKKLRHIKLSAR